MSHRELSVVMRPTARMLEQRLDGSPDRIDQSARPHVAGGEVSMRVTEAPGIPGKWLGAIIEQWPNGHLEILGACHAESATACAAICLPQLEQILRSRKV